MNTLFLVITTALVWAVGLQGPAVLYGVLAAMAGAVGYACRREWVAEREIDISVALRLEMQAMPAGVTQLASAMREVGPAMTRVAVAMSVDIPTIVASMASVMRGLGVADEPTLDDFAGQARLTRQRYEPGYAWSSAHGCWVETDAAFRVRCMTMWYAKK
jgi:hypothetical protein